MFFWKLPYQVIQERKEEIARETVLDDGSDEASRSSTGISQQILK